MSRFLTEKYASLVPYVPGEQPREMKYVKLNTNESPFPPSERAIEAAKDVLAKLNLYSDNDSTELRHMLAKRYGVQPENVLCTNGSDEALYFAFLAFCDSKNPAYFADQTYGFYPVFADITGVPYTLIDLRDDFTLDIEPYKKADGTVFITNPNAPTGIALKRDQIEELLKAQPDHIVVIDEAYVDFGAESCVPLTHIYDNLLVVQTFSKSRSMAGARLGYAIGNEALIRDLNTIRNSTNPYNVNTTTMAAGTAALMDQEYTDRNCAIIMENRQWTADALKALGFEMTESSTNFLFARHPEISGEEVYRKLRERGVLVRHFTKPRIADYNRITIGSREQMEILVNSLKDILAEKREQA